MSTKSTIAHGKDFHLYHDGNFGVRDKYVFFELDNCDFVAYAKSKITVRIPLQIWEFTRRYPGMSFDLAKLSDAELKQEVERRVDKNIDDYRKAGEGSKWLFFEADLPRKRQIRELYERLAEDREWERKVLRDIKRFEYGMSPEALEEHNRKARRWQAARKAARARWDKARRGKEAVTK